MLCKLRSTPIPSNHVPAGLLIFYFFVLSVLSNQPCSHSYLLSRSIKEKITCMYSWNILSVSLDVWFSSSCAFLSHPEGGGRFWRRNWEPQIKLRAARGALCWNLAGEVWLGQWEDNGLSSLYRHLESGHLIPRPMDFHVGGGCRFLICFLGVVAKESSVVVLDFSAWWKNPVLKKVC